MFTDSPALNLVTADRHQQLLAEAERFRLVKLAKAARREACAARRHVPPVRPPAPVPAAQGRVTGNVDAERRCPVPR